MAISETKKQLIREITEYILKERKLFLHTCDYQASEYQFRLREKNKRRANDYRLDSLLLLQVLFTNSIGKELYDRLFYKERLIPSLSSKQEVYVELRSIFLDMIERAKYLHERDTANQQIADMYITRAKNATSLAELDSLKQELIDTECTRCCLSSIAIDKIIREIEFYASCLRELEYAKIDEYTAKIENVETTEHELIDLEEEIIHSSLDHQTISRLLANISYQKMLKRNNVYFTYQIEEEISQETDIIALDTLLSKIETSSLASCQYNPLIALVMAKAKEVSSNSISTIMKSAMPLLDRKFREVKDDCSDLATLQKTILCEETYTTAYRDTNNAITSLFRMITTYKVAIIKDTILSKKGVVRTHNELFHRVLMQTMKDYIGELYNLFLRLDFDKILTKIRENEYSSEEELENDLRIIISEDDREDLLIRYRLNDDDDCADDDDDDDNTCYCYDCETTIIYNGIFTDCDSGL